ncbi:tRNA(adenine34) deaminase [Nakamurella sp. UYEF19]|uniref:nucleoside deaminase n=1 Tax=Nakamurella sp. UYEF19 TaxID=1756392 RepID=UPI0033956347
MNRPVGFSAHRRADEELIRSALAAAGQAAASDDVPIGAVLLDASGAQVASACNAREATGDPTAHAEILVLRKASHVAGTWNLAGSTLAVTAEPCTMCAGAITLARVSVVVFGCWEPKTGAAGSLWDVLRDRRLTHRVEVRGGVLADECAALLVDFFARHR